MPDQECNLAHRYVIATRKGLSPVFHTAKEAGDYRSRLIQPTNSAWVAFHQVPIEALVNNPDTIQIYCSTETRRVETPLSTVTLRS